MNWIDYFSVASAFLGAALLGRYFVTTTVFSSLLAGTSVAGAVLAVSGWLVPGLSRQIVIAIFSTAAIGQLLQNDIKLRLAAFDWRILVYLALTLILFRHFSYQEYFYNNHDPAYWGYAFELLKADYFGPIRVPTFYPEQIAPTHILPSTAVASLSVFLPDITLPKLIEVRYLLVSVVFAGLLYRLTALAGDRAAFIWLGVICSYYIFEFEIGFNVLISSYFYVLLLSELMLLMASDRTDTKAVLFFSLILTVARAPIIYMAIGLFLYYWLIFKEDRFDYSLLVTGILIFAIGVTWIVFPAPFSLYCLDLSVNFVNPFNYEDLSTISQISRWLMPDIFQRWYFDSFYVSQYDEFRFLTESRERVAAFLTVLPLVVYVILKFYVSTAWAALELKTALPMQKRALLNGLLLFLGLSLLGWLFIRNGFLFDHQAHAYLLMSVPAFFLVTLLCAFRPKTLWLIVPIALLYSTADGVFHKPFSSNFSKGIPARHIRYDRTRHMVSEQEFYVPGAGQPMWETEIEAMMVGSRVKASDYALTTIEREFSGDDADPTSIMPAWVVSPEYLRDCD